MFSLDARLAQDTHVMGDFALCRLLLSNDARYPWFILVPRRPDITEVFELNDADRELLWRETHTLAKLLHHAYGADKINIATLGNVVGQLHMHVIVRYRTDAAWPAPVWGRLAAIPYTAEQLAAVRGRLASALGTDFVFAEGEA